VSHDVVPLSNGMRLYAVSGIIGINADLDIFSGEDDRVVRYDTDEELTTADQVALGERMVALWTQYLARARSL
jgi:hypothetical protein